VVPNAEGLLRRLGVHVEDEGAILLQQIRLVNQSGELLSTTDIAKTAGRWQNNWFCAHRVHLHKHLKKVATSADGKGRPVLVHTSSKVAKADPHTGTIVLPDGTQSQGDLIVGADGVHSVTRAAVTEKEFLPFKSDHSAMRFLITKESALADPVTHDWVAPNGSMDMWYGPDLKIVLYPCVNNTLFNFVCIHPAALSNVSDDYNQSGSKKKLLEIYRDFEPRVLRLLEKANAGTLKVYPLFDMEPLPTFVNDRLALIGDAAHPFTPHLGQGAAMAIEDAISLGVMLPLGTTPDEIPERLKLYNQARYERATTIQNNSRLLGNSSSKCTFSASLLYNMSETNHGLEPVYEFMDHGLSHDEYHTSTQILRENQWQNNHNLYWRQPTVFGPMPGPRQTYEGSTHQSSSSSSSSIKARIKFKTSATLLRTLFPNSSYRFSKPDTVALASFSVETQENMAWLGGGSYDLLAFYIHDVEYTTRTGETLHGSYCPVMFENLTDPILSGREELGYPKLYSDISITERNDGDGNSSSVEARISWRGAEWATFLWQGLRDSIPQNPASSVEAAGESGSSAANDGTDTQAKMNDSPRQEGMMVHKFIPASDGVDRAKRRADAEYDVFIQAVETEETKIKRVRQVENAEFQFQDLGFQKLPTLHHIVGRLAEIPVFDVVEASIVYADGVGDLSGARKIEACE
jgi:2-polyprenyl-6-methoxyphenol hydroxylase-like FAD-dependent oxidoreductase